MLHEYISSFFPGKTSCKGWKVGYAMPTRQTELGERLREARRGYARLREATWTAQVGAEDYPLAGGYARLGGVQG